MQVKVTRIIKRDTDKDGVKLISKRDQKPYWKISIKVEGSEDWLSGFANNTSDPRYLMEEGGTYHIAIEEKNVGDRVFKNFRMLKPEEIKMAEMEAEIARLKGEKIPTSTETAYNESHTTVEDLDKF